MELLKSIVESATALFKKIKSIFVKIAKGLLEMIDCITIISNGFIIMNICMVDNIGKNQKLLYVFSSTILILIIYGIITGVVRIYKANKKQQMPIPNKRFTKNKFGCVEVEDKRLSELILYMLELEDYLERNGMLNESE